MYLLFTAPNSVLLYLSDNVLLYLALIRPIFVLELLSSQIEIKYVKKKAKQKQKQKTTTHCLKSVPIRSYSGPHFPVFGVNTERCRVSGVSLHIQSECGKMRIRITPNMNTFNAAVTYAIM